MTYWIDVDDTLLILDPMTGVEVPNFELAGIVQWLLAARFEEVRIWSGGGIDNVVRAVRKLGLDGSGIWQIKFKNPSLPKSGDIVVDDTAWVTQGMNGCYSIDVGILDEGVMAYTPEQFIEKMKEEVGSAY